MPAAKSFQLRCLKRGNSMNIVHKYSLHPRYMLHFTLQPSYSMLTNTMAWLHQTGSHWIKSKNSFDLTYLAFSPSGIFEMRCSGKMKLLCGAMIHMIVCLILLLSNQSCSQENKYAMLSWISICYSA